MVSVNFIISSWSYWNQPLKQQPMTQLYLATVVDEHFEGKGVRPCITDLRGLEKELQSSKIPESDLYLYSVTSPDFAEVKSLVGQLRTKYPKSKHIAGGAHINIFPEESSKVFDSIVVGDGERSLVQLVSDFQGGYLEPIYNLNANYDLVEYPFARRHYLPKAKIVNSNLFKTEKIRSTTALFAHGCPFNCGFCANYNRRKSVRRKNHHIVEEIEYLKKEYSIEGISLLEEICIPLKEEEAIPYLEAIGKKNVKWRGMIRAGISQKLLKLARDCGCLELSFGVESVSQRVVDIANKGIKLAEVKKTIKHCKENGIKTQIYLLNGLPGEPQNIVQLTKTFIDETQPDLVLVSSLCPYPGSPIFNNPDYYGIKWIDHNYEKYNHLVCRFSDSQDNPEDLLPFEYYAVTRWGKALSRKQILNNLFELQDFFIERGLNK